MKSFLPTILLTLGLLQSSTSTNLRRRQSEAATAKLTAGGFCSYPMWTIPEVGTDDRCDDESGHCSKRIDAKASPDCDDSYGVFGGGVCVVRCAEDADGGAKTEAWTCSTDERETWVLTSEGIECGRGEVASAVA
jgi:hypothetical protein